MKDGSYNFFNVEDFLNNGIIGFMVRRTFGELLKFPER